MMNCSRRQQRSAASYLLTLCMFALSAILANGEHFAQAFGPSSRSPLVTSAEVGNEPSKYSEAQYRAIFEAMARGLRAGDPKLKIATCAVMTGKPDEWSKPMTAIAGLEDLYDVVNV